MNTISGIADVRRRVGQELGTSNWYEIRQAQVDAFARATGDDYWLHVDPVRAAGTPFGGTIAHGLFTLSLGPKFSYEIYEIRDVELSLNYGYGRVRFPAPVPVGSRVRMRAALDGIQDVDGGVQLTIIQTFEREGSDKPVCIAEALLRVIAGP
jgi:acyl dehydratase